jgi:T-complex protein 1 subunit epsilon
MYVNAHVFIAQIPSIEQYAMRAFASALDAIPQALAENSGLSSIETLTEIKSRQVNEKNTKLGIDCNGRGQNGMLRLRSLCDFEAELCSADMKEQFVYDPLLSKRQQYLLATQLVRAVLKIDDVITAGEADE